MKSRLNRQFSFSLVAVFLMGTCAFADAKYDGMTFDQAREYFESELTPALQAKALNILIQFAIRGQHADEVAALLVQEGRTMPVELFESLDPNEEVSLLNQLFVSLHETDETESTNEVQEAFFPSNEVQHWRRVVSGVHRLALPHRKVFEEVMVNSGYPLNVRILARIAVQHADIHTAKVEKWLESIPQKLETAKAEIRQGDIVTIEMQFQGKDNQTGREVEAMADIHTTVVNVLDDKSLCLEYRKTTQSEQGLDTVHVSGRVRAEEIDQERRVHSSKISDLIVEKQHKNLAWFSVQNILEQFCRYLP